MPISVERVVFPVWICKHLVPISVATERWRVSNATPNRKSVNVYWMHGHHRSTYDIQSKYYVGCFPSFFGCHIMCGLICRPLTPGQRVVRSLVWSWPESGTDLSLIWLMNLWVAVPLLSVSNAFEHCRRRDRARFWRHVNCREPRD